ASGTGVAFTRDPSTGEVGLFGEFLADAQGEDVVAGIRTPEPIEAMQKKLPEAFDQLLETIRRLEEHYRDMQDIEFTVEERGLAGESGILVRWETTPDDIHGLIQASGILTAHGGMTSHAAVVARGMGKPCVAGCEGLTIDLEKRTLNIGGHQLAEGDMLT